MASPGGPQKSASGPLRQHGCKLDCRYGRPVLSPDHPEQCLRAAGLSRVSILNKPTLQMEHFKNIESSRIGSRRRFRRDECGSPAQRTAAVRATAAVLDGQRLLRSLSTASAMLPTRPTDARSSSALTPNFSAQSRTSKSYSKLIRWRSWPPVLVLSSDIGFSFRGERTQRGRSRFQKADSDESLSSRSESPSLPFDSPPWPAESSPWKPCPRCRASFCRSRIRPWSRSRRRVRVGFTK